jgi:Mrp family chromosome partitioning ATPase
MDCGNGRFYTKAGKRFPGKKRHQTDRHDKGSYMTAPSSRLDIELFGPAGPEQFGYIQARRDHIGERLANRLSVVKHRLAVMSGKDGVGKSTVTGQSCGSAGRGWEEGRRAGWRN